MRDDGHLDWFDVGVSRQTEVITEGEYRRKVAAWWGVTLPEDAPTLPSPSTGEEITAADIGW